MLKNRIFVLTDNVHAEIAQHKADVEMFLPKAQAQSFLKGGTFEKRSLMRQGIVCECCYNVCSFGEMSEYCRDDGPGTHVTKKSAYKSPGPRYARIGAAKAAQLQALSRTATQGRSDRLSISGDTENEVGLEPELVRHSDGELQDESFYLRTLVTKDRYPSHKP